MYFSKSEIMRVLVILKNFKIQHKPSFYSNKGYICVKRSKKPEKLARINYLCNRFKTAITPFVLFSLSGSLKAIPRIAVEKDYRFLCSHVPFKFWVTS